MRDVECRHWNVVTASLTRASHDQQQALTPESSTGQQEGEEKTKSYYTGKRATERKPVRITPPISRTSMLITRKPKQKFDKDDHVRHTDTNGVTHDCTVEEAKLDDGVWKYKLRLRTIDQASYKAGALIPEGKLVAC